jgi:predicted transcriptional regulator
MKTAVSLPDDVFRAAERLRQRVDKSRSQLYAEAIAEYLARHSPDAITEQLDRLAEALGDAPDDFGREAARRLLARSEW